MDSNDKEQVAATIAAAVIQGYAVAKQRAVTPAQAARIFEWCKLELYPEGRDAEAFKAYEAARRDYLWPHLPQD
jgi:hypothetical protein